MNASPQKQNGVVVVLRWIACLPAALLASQVAYLAVRAANNVEFGSHGMDPGSFLVRACVGLAANIAFGAVTVWVAAYVAPSFKKQVGVVIAALVLFVSGAAILAALRFSLYWEVYAMVCTNIGAIGMALHLFTQQQPESTESGGFQQED